MGVWQCLGGAAASRRLAEVEGVRLEAELSSTNSLKHNYNSGEESA